MIYVIAYDVSDDGQRSKISRYLEGWGRRVQRSLFECDLSTEEVKRVREQIEDWLDLKTDCCHIYPLCSSCAAKRKVLGNELEEAWGDVVVI